MAAGGALVILAALALITRGGWRETSLALLLWLLPFGLVVALGLRSGLFEVRYLVLGLPGLMLLAALGIARLLRPPVLAPCAAAPRRGGHAPAAGGPEEAVRPRVAGVMGDERGGSERRDLRLDRRKRLYGHPSLVRLGAAGAGRLLGRKRLDGADRCAARQR